MEQTVVRYYASRRRAGASRASFTRHIVGDATRCFGVEMGHNSLLIYDVYSVALTLSAVNAQLLKP